MTFAIVGLVLGAIIAGWGVWAVCMCIYYTLQDPSVGGAAMIGVICGSIAILIGSVLIGVAA